jgi:hypothetical protein
MLSTPRLADGRIKYREDIVDDLANAPEASIGMLEGKNFGKPIIRVAKTHPTQGQPS